MVIMADKAVVRGGVRMGQRTIHVIRSIKVDKAAIVFPWNRIEDAVGKVFYMRGGFDRKGGFDGREGFNGRGGDIVRTIIS